MDKKINNNGYDYVDLGLPSGTLWSICNVGASNPSDSGLYFQWGDTIGYKASQVGIGEGKKKFRIDWNDYKWNPSGDGKTFTKYATPGATLDLEDDAAHANMGGNWHMPTDDQIFELFTNTRTAWTTSDGVKCMKITSIEDTFKFIFIPAAGNAWDGSVKGSGVYGRVWSSMMSTDSITMSQCFGLYSYGYTLEGGYNRYFGLSVRGVIG